MDFTPDNPTEGIARDEKGRFTSKAKQLEILTTRAKELGAAYSASNATIQQLNASLASSQKAAQRQVDNLTASFKQQLSQLRDHDRTINAVARSTEGLTSSLVKAGAALWAMHAAWRAVIHLADSKMGAALLAGPSAVSGLTSSRQLTMLGQLFQSPALRFGARGQTIAASGKLTAAVQGLGDEGLRAISDFVKTLEPKAAQGFVEAVNARGVKEAVSQFTSAQNYGAADTVRNALDITDQAKAGTLDPLLQAVVNATTGMEQLRAAIEKMADGLAKLPIVQGAAKFAADNPGTALALGIAGVVGGKAALTRGLPWAVRGLLGAGGAAGAAEATGAGLTAIPTITGFAPAAATGAGAAGAAGMGALATGGVITGIAALGAYDLWGTYQAGKQGIGLYQDLQARKAADAATLTGAGKLTGIGERNAASDDALMRLRGQRQIQSAQIAKYETEHRRGTFAQFWGASEYSDADKANIEAMRDHYARLQKQIDDLVKSTAGATTAFQVESEATTAARKAAEEKAKADEERDRKMREQFATHQQAALEAATAASYVPIAQTALQQQQQFGGLTDILSRIQLTPEQQKYQAALQNQIDKLTAELATIDTTSEATKEQAEQQANAIVDQLSKLRGEQKAIQKQQLDLGEKDYGDKLTLMRQQLQIAEATPIGWLGAGQELHALQDALQKEIQRLADLMASIDQSTEEGQRQARQYQIQQNQLRLELKQSRLQELQALLDNAVGQAAQAGKFEKVIIDGQHNLEAGLRKGIVNYDPRVVGNIAGAPDGWHPRTMSDVLRARGSADETPLPPMSDSERKRLSKMRREPTTISNDPAVLLTDAAKMLLKGADALADQRTVDDLADKSTGHHYGARGGNIIPN